MENSVQLEANEISISGRAGAAPALEPRETSPPARSTASAGYVAAAP